MVDALSPGSMPSVGTGSASLLTAAIRARDIGTAPGVLQPGALNTITDVAGAAVGNTTLTDGKGTRTGVTAILLQHGNVSQLRVPRVLPLATASENS